MDYAFKVAHEEYGAPFNYAIRACLSSARSKKEKYTQGLVIHNAALKNPLIQIHDHPGTWNNQILAQEIVVSLFPSIFKFGV